MRGAVLKCAFCQRSGVEVLSVVVHSGMGPIEVQPSAGAVACDEHIPDAAAWTAAELKRQRDVVSSGGRL